MDNSKQETDETCRAIGRFIYEFSQTEYTIRHYLALEIKLDEQHFDAIVGSYDVALLCTVATKVFHDTRDKENAEQIEKIIKEFRRLNDERNRVAHGLWVPFKDGGTIHHVARSSLTSKAHSAQAVALEKLAGQANDIRAKLESAFLHSEFLRNAFSHGV